MESEKLLRQAGFYIQSSDGKPTRWGVSPDIYKRTARFQQFIKEALMAPADRTGLLAARLVALDGVSVHALRRLETQKCTPYSIAGEVYLQWQDAEPTRTERRRLSPCTLRSWLTYCTDDADPTSRVRSIQPATQMLAGLDTFLAESQAYAKCKDARTDLHLDSLGWWHQALPPTLFAHLGGIGVLSALPRQTWARLETQQIAIDDAQAQAMSSNVGATGELIDAALESQGDDRGRVVLRVALDYLGERSSQIDGVNKRTWALNMLSLRQRALAAGPVTALLIAWVADLCESGTVATANPADSTVQSYSRRALLPLHGALSQHSDDLDSCDWSPGRLALLYESIIQAQSRGNQGPMRSALACFHNFLVRNLDVDPLYQPLKTDEVESCPHAEVVWPHELTQAIEWSDRHGDPRIARAAAIILSIAHESPCRCEELLRLRCRNIHLRQDARGCFAEIEIARDARSGRLKTLTSQRRLTVRAPATLPLLVAWLDQRLAEGATADAFLFGDPTEMSERYQPSATAAHVTRLLKAATGMTTVHLHTLRHTAISRMMATIWGSNAWLDINPIEVLAAEAGHASPLTTLRTYSHRYEAGLRLWLDVAMSELIHLNGPEAAAVTGLSPALVRARSSRSATPLNELAWQLVRALDVAGCIPRAEDGFSWQAPRPPSDHSRPASELRPEIVIAILLARVLDNTPYKVLARRFDMDPEALAQWESALTAYCSQRARQVFPRRALHLDRVDNGLHGALVRLGINLRRLHQSKFSRLHDGLDQDDRLLQEAVTSWENCHTGDHIALNDGSQALDLFRLLRACRVDGHALRLCMQPAADSVIDPRMQQSAMEAFEAAFGTRPRVTLMAHSPNRPAAYLQWDGAGSPGATGGASGGSIAGLHAALLCIKAYLLMHETN